MSNIKLFQEKIISNSSDHKQYVKRMKQRDTELVKGWVQIVPTLATSVPNINMPISNILKDKELDSNSVIKDYLITAD
jgi:hypothetical protein